MMTEPSEKQQPDRHERNAQSVVDLLKHAVDRVSTHSLASEQPVRRAVELVACTAAAEW